MPDMWVDCDTAVVVPVNLLPLTDDTDFKTIETAVVYNSTGMDLVWNFVTCAGATTATAVTPTTGGAYDWTEHIANKGMYSIEIPASGGASINNDTEGVGWFTGVATGVLPWRGPTIGFRRAALNDLLIDGGTASTNLEDMFDGTGYAGGTAKLTVDVVAISGDTTAADNCELMFDGTGYAGGTTKLDVNAASISNGAITAAVIATGAIDADAIADNAIDAGALAADCITAAKVANGAIDAATFAADVDAEIATMVWNAATASYGGAGTYGQAVEDALADTNELQTDWVNGGRLDLILDAAGAAGDPWSTALPGAYGAGTAGLILGTQGATAIPTAAAVADAVWDEASTGHTDAGKAGAQVWTDIDAILEDTGTTLDGKIDAIDNYVDTEIGALASTLGAAGAGLTAVPWNAAWDAEVQSECTDALNAYDPPTKAELDSAQAAVVLADGTSDAVIADAVWNAATGSYGGVGTYGQAAEDTLADTNELQGNQGDWLTATGFSTHSAADVWSVTTRALTDKAGFALADATSDAVIADAVWNAATATYGSTGTYGETVEGMSLTAGDIADAVWNETAGDHVTAGSTGKALIDANNGTPPTASAVATQVRTELTTELGRIDAAVSSRLATAGYTTPPTATENADALLNRDMSTVSDTNSRSPLNALRALRNKVAISGSTMTVYEEDDATSAWTATVTSDSNADPITAMDPS